MTAPYETTALIQPSDSPHIKADEAEKMVEQQKTLSALFQWWIDFNTGRYIQDGATVTDDTKLMNPPEWPSHSTLKAWVAATSESASFIHQQAGQIADAHAETMQQFEQTRSAVRERNDWAFRAETAEAKYTNLLAESATIKDRADRLESENEALRVALNPRLWTREMDAAWHRAIPDVYKAFSELRALAK